jgi:hypothetical protein
MFDTSAKVGGMTFDPSGDIAKQVANICDVLVKKAGEERREEELVSQEREQINEASGEA